MIESAVPNRANNFSSLKVYILVFLFLVLAVESIMPYIATFRQNRGCETYLNLAKAYNFSPLSCLQYSLQKYIVPAVAMVLPFLFIILVILFKEKKKECPPTKLRKEKIAFLLSVFSILTFMLSYDLITGIRCEGFGCLGLAPLIAASVIIFPPLIFGFSLWFLMARYQWKKQKFLAVAIVQIILLIGAYMQTPLF